MTMPTNADLAGTAVPSNEPQPLDLHGLYRAQSACGYDRDLTLRADQVQTITARLRGISAIASVFIAANDSDALALSDWLRGGLMEAIHHLTRDTHYDIERAVDRAQRQGGAA